MQPIEITIRLEDLMSGIIEAIIEKVGELADTMSSAAEEMTGSISSVEDQASGLGDAFAAVSEGSDAAATAIGTLGDTASVAAGALQEETTALGENAAAAVEAAAAKDGAAVANNAAGVAAANNAENQDKNTTSTNNLASAMNGLRLPIFTVAGGLLAAGVAAVVSGGQFETQMSVVKSLAANTSDNIGQMTQQLMQMAIATGTSPAELASGLYFVMSASFHGADAMRVLDVVTRAAAGSMADAHIVADVLTSTLNDYSAGANQAQHYMNMLLTVVKDGKTTMSDLAPTISRVATTAAASKIPFDQAGAALAVLTQQAHGAHLPSMQLANLLSVLGLRTDLLANRAAGLGLKFDLQKYSAMDLVGKLKYLSDITGDNSQKLDKLVGNATAFRAIYGVLGTHTKDFAAALKDMDSNVDLTSQTFDSFRQTSEFTWNQIKAAAGVAAVQLANALKPLVEQIGKTVIPLLERFSSWASTHGAEIRRIFVLLAGAVLSMVSSFVIFGPVTKVFSTYFSILKDGGGGLKKAFDEVTKTFGKLTDFGKGVYGTFKSLGEQAVEFAGHLGHVVKFLGSSAFDAFKGVLGSIGTGFSKLGGILAKFPNPMQLIENGFTQLSKVGGLLQRGMDGVFSIGDRLSGLFGKIGPLLAKIPNPVQLIENGFSQLSKVGGLLQAGMDGVFSASDKLFGFLARSPQMALKGLQAGFGGLRTLFTTGLPMAFSALQGGFSSLMGIIAGGIPAILGAAGTFLAFLGPILLVGAAIAAAVIIFLNFRKQFMGAVDAIWQAVKPAFQGVKTEIHNALTLIEAKWKQVWPQLKPAVLGLIDAIKRLAPTFQLAATVIGAVLRVIIGIVVAVASAFLSALGPVINVISGVIRIIGDLGAIIVDVFTGKWGKILPLIADLGKTFLSILQNAAAAILNFIGGFIGSILGWFKHLWSELVGHSIIPDMIKSIVDFFFSLPGKILGMLAGLVGNIIAGFAKMEIGALMHVGKLVTGAISAVAHMNIPVISGIAGMAQGVISHVGSMVNGVKGLFDQVSKYAADKAAIQRDQVTQHALEQKMAVVSNTEEQEQRTIAATEQQRNDIIAKLKDCKDQATREMLQQKLNVVNEHLQMHMQALSHAASMRADIAAQMKALKEDAIKHAQDMRGNVVGEFGNMVGQAAGQLRNGNIIGAVQTVVSGSLNIVGQLVSGFASAAAHAIAGFVSGIGQHIGDALGAVKNFGGQVLGAIGNIFQSHSPSKVMEQHGQYFVDGLISGITNNTGRAVSAAKQLGTAVSNAVNLQTRAPSGIQPTISLSSAALSNASANQHITVNLNLQGGLGSGLQLLNPTDRRRVATQISQELGGMTALQGIAGYGYTGRYS